MVCNRKFRAILGGGGDSLYCKGDSRAVASRILRLARPDSDKTSAERSGLLAVLRRKLGSIEAQMKDGMVLDIRSADMPDSGSISLVSDVSQRRRQAQIVARSEAAKKAVIVSALDCIIVADQRGRITEFNPAAERTFGWSAAEIIGKHLHETIVPPDMRSEHLRGMRDFERTGTGPVINSRIEISAMRKSGEIFPCELAIAPINVDGETQFTAYLRDISERKQSERELEETRELAEKANHAKSDFLAGISHEIRTPMNAIIGYVELLRDSPLDAEQKHFAEGISASAECLLELISDILDIARLEAGKLEVECEPFSPVDVAESVSRVTRVLADSKGLHFATSMDCPPEVYFAGDAGRIRQIMLNLTGNAVKFTEQGKVHLSLRVMNTREGQPFLEFAVSDTGVGIVPHELVTVFKPFEQVRNTAQKSGGTGLGLAISRDLARRMGGDIEVVSEFGAGCDIYAATTGCARESSGGRSSAGKFALGAYCAAHAYSRCGRYACKPASDSSPSGKAGP